MSTGNAIVTVNLGLPSDLRGLARFAAGLSSDFPGDLLLLNGKNGMLSSGTYEFKPPVQFAMFPGETQAGHVKWIDGKMADDKWGRVADPDFDLDELRGSLGDTDPKGWKRYNAKGEPEDPYKVGVRVPMVGWSERRGSLFTFSSTANSAVRSTRRLVKDLLVQIKANPDLCAGRVPLIEITVGDFDTSNGKVYFPRFDCLDWLPVGVVLHSLAKTGQASAFGVSNEAALNQDLGEELTPENTTKPKSKSGPRM